jgi:hypothetical protein
VQYQNISIKRGIHQILYHNDQFWKNKLENFYVVFLYKSNIFWKIIFSRNNWWVPYSYGSVWGKAQNIVVNRITTIWPISANI